MAKRKIIHIERHVKKLKVGIIGSASGPQVEEQIANEKALRMGREIARRGYILINGACPGIPDRAAEGAHEEGGLVIGISPAFSEYEHIHEYMSPKHHDIILYTGMGFMERDIINIRSCDGVILVSGGIGTLNEFTIAYDEGRPLGVLTNSGGISNSIPHVIEQLCKRRIPPNMVFDDDPVKLLDKLEVAIKTFPLPIHEDGRVKDHHLGRG